ncbi:MAG: hypothetical protein AB7V77_05950 [Candidatus Woesearchaeota archaeon]
MDLKTKINLTVLSILSLYIGICSKYQSNRLEKELTPAKEEFKQVVEKYAAQSKYRQLLTDFGGELDSVVVNKNKFLSDNGAFGGAWQVYCGDPIFRSVIKISFNPTDYELNTSALKKYK